MLIHPDVGLVWPNGNSFVIFIFSVESRVLKSSSWNIIMGRQQPESGPTPFLIPPKAYLNSSFDLVYKI